MTPRPVPLRRRMRAATWVMLTALGAALLPLAALIGVLMAAPGAARAQGLLDAPAGWLCVSVAGDATLAGQLGAQATCLQVDRRQALGDPRRPAAVGIRAALLVRGEIKLTGWRLLDCAGRSAFWGGPQNAYEISDATEIPEGSLMHAAAMRVCRHAAFDSILKPGVPL